MVKHVLFVKMKDNSPEACEKVKALFLTMKEHIDFIRDLHVGIDYLHSDRSYDIVLELTVDNPAELERYQSDPYHAGTVKPYIHEVRSASAIVDYEF